MNRTSCVQQDETTFAYNQRVSIIREMLNRLKELFLKDELLKTLKNNGTSQEFVSIRVNEIIEAFLSSEREQFLKTTYEKYINLKEKYNEVNKIFVFYTIFFKKKKKVQEYSELYSREKNKNRQTKEEVTIYERKIEKLEKQIFEFQNNEEKIQSLYQENEELKKSIEIIYREKNKIEQKYKAHTMEMEKVEDFSNKSKIF